MNIAEIKEMIQAVVESGVAELEIQRGENRVRIVRGASQQEFHVVPATQAAPPVYPAAPPSALAQPPAPVAEEVTQTVKSPIVGTFYRAARHLSALVTR